MINNVKIHMYIDTLLVSMLISKTVVNFYTDNVIHSVEYDVGFPYKVK